MAKEKLFKWQKPKSMARLVDELMNEVGSEHLFNQGGLGFLRDAWIAAEFAKARSAEFVSLIDDVWPDFRLRIGRTEELFEAVEADDPSRRRGEEYRNLSGELEDDPVEDWIARAEQAPDWIRRACRKKLDKHYGSKPNLVVYLNMTEYGIRHKEVEACFPLATSIVKNCFQEVWILWNNFAYPVWKDGRRRD
jgi:hypothetical protein